MAHILPFSSDWTFKFSNLSSVNNFQVLTMNYRYLSYFEHFFKIWAQSDNFGLSYNVKSNFGQYKLFCILFARFCFRFVQFLFHSEQSSAQAAYRSTNIFASTLTICVDLLATNISHYALVICAILSASLLINCTI